MTTFTPTSAIIFVLLLSGLTVGGCTTDIISETPPTIPAEVSFSQPLSKAEANSRMAEIVAAINQEKINQLLPYLLKRDQTPANVKAALADYDIYFQGQDISNFELLNVEELGETGEGFPITRFHYRLESENGISKEVALYQENSLRFHDQFFDYSYWSKELLNRYLTAIQLGDVQGLAQILSPEDVSDAADNAQQLIDAYTAQFDRETLNYEFQELTETGQQFIYTITGSKGNVPVEHPVTIVYGDGLVGIQDSISR